MYVDVNRNASGSAIEVYILRTSRTSTKNIHIINLCLRSLYIYTCILPGKVYVYCEVYVTTNCSCICLHPVCRKITLPVISGTLLPVIVCVCSFTL